MTLRRQKNILSELKQAKTSVECSDILQKFYHDTSHLVYAFCKKKGLSTEDAEEIVQIIYIKIFNKRHNYNPDNDPLAWLYIITRSETKDYLKSNRIYKNYVAEFSDFLSQTQSQNPSSIEDTKDVQNLLNENLSVLSQNELMALKLRYSDEEEFDYIAEKMNTSSLNIRKIISRGIKKIKGRSSSNV